MDKAEPKKSFLIPILGVLALVAIWYFFIRSDAAPAPVTFERDPAELSAMANLELLRELQAIQLDEGIFNDPVFIALSDFSTVISPEPVGRPNPFLPFDGQNIPTKKTVTPRR